MRADAPHRSWCEVEGTFNERAPQELPIRLQCIVRDFFPGRSCITRYYKARPRPRVTASAKDNQRLNFLEWISFRFPGFVQRPNWYGRERKGEKATFLSSWLSRRGDA